MLQALPDAPLDIIGDVHGELTALRRLLARLGYDEDGRHPAGRRLVFVGDLCDRGPDSPGVVALVQRLATAGHALALAGNHELNLLRGQRKEGNDWFWNEGTAQDRKFEPYARLPASQREATLAFFDRLPLALVREDLRIVHAAWHGPSVAQLASSDATCAGSTVLGQFRHWETRSRERLDALGLLAGSEAEKVQWAHALKDPDQPVPLLTATGRCDEARQMGNPVRVLTSGVERLASQSFYSSGQWRFVERVRWWDHYTDDIPVVVGHYWRKWTSTPLTGLGKGGPDLFAGIPPLAWHGARGNVYCVDFSVGGRFHERATGQPEGSHTRLAALQWPERTLTLDTGECLPTQGWAQPR